MKMTQTGIGWIGLCFGIGVTLMADSFIGVASTRGSMSIDQETVRGNANVAKGTSIGTSDTVSLVELLNGVRLVVGQHSEVGLHEDRAELRRGGALLHGEGRYSIEALGYRFHPVSNSAVARVAFEGSDRVLVAAVSGPIRVLDGQGTLLANLSAGNSYFFEAESDPQSARGAGQQTPSKGVSKVRKMTKMKWGLIASTAGGVGASIGLVSALNGNNASR